MEKIYNMFLIFRLKWMQSRQLGVPGMERNSNLEWSDDGQFGYLWVILGFGSCDQGVKLMTWWTYKDYPAFGIIPVDMED